jgi:UDP-galactopyranose mutase
MYDYIIVGSGFTGSVLARRLAEEQNKRVLIIERRNHIAGNMYDELNEHGILVQRYGIHVFHTDKDEVYNYLSRFCEWEPYTITSLAEIHGKLVPVPFNFEAIDKFYSAQDAERLKLKLLTYFNGASRVPVIEVINSSDDDIRKYGEFLFENDYKPYTCKQWGRNPDEIDVSILNRVPIALSYENRYFSNKYQSMPKDGFTNLFHNMLDHPNIEIQLGKDLLDIIHFDNINHNVYIENYDKSIPIIYTGALDELFQFSLGDLPYRTLRFEYKTFNVDKYQQGPFIVYPLHEKLTRVTEFKYITGQIVPNLTTIVEEYPMEYDRSGNMQNDPFYPIINNDNNALAKKYNDLAKEYNNLIVCGRLSDYKYYDMDNAIMRAFEVFETLT